MLKDMRARSRSKSNSRNTLAPNGGGVAGEPRGSAPKGSAPRGSGDLEPGLRSFFAPGTPASAEATPGGSAGPPADVDELVEPLGHAGRSAAVDVATAAAAEPVGGLAMEASIWSGTGAAVTGPDIEPDVVPTDGSGVQVLAAADRSRAFTASPPAAGLVGGA